MPRQTHREVLYHRLISIQVKRTVHPAAGVTAVCLCLLGGYQKGSVLLLTRLALAPCHFGTLAGAEGRYLPAQ